MPTLPLLATSELVVTTWIGTIPGLSTQMVATQLPADVAPDGTPAAWLSTGFVTVAVVGGNPDPLLPTHAPVMQINCWAARPGSNKPPWWFANVIAQTIWKATMPGQPVNRLLDLSAGGVSYPAAVVDSVSVMTEPRRMYNDPADYAMYSFDAQFRWRSVADAVP